jgi:hypothetical protein
MQVEGLRRRMLSVVLVLFVVLILSGTWLITASTRDNGRVTWSWTELRATAGDMILPFFLDEHTRYAAGYREENFRALKLGASEATAQSQLGEPLARRSFADGRTIWYYSEQATGTDNYLQRNLTFDSRGRLVRKYSRFYVD